MSEQAVPAVPAVDAPLRPTTVLIAALGGEGGGVLSKWIVDAAEAAGHWVQSTSVPGVAQRTGATTYYVEMCPPGSGADADRQPVMALLPCPGAVDVFVASELLEAGRAAQNGFITPDRTAVIASTHRIYAIAEKSAMADGRFDMTRVLESIGALAERTLLADFGALARQSGTVINAVLYGAVAGSGKLPISREGLEESIRRGGIAVEANLAGFAAGYDLATDLAARPVEQPEAVVGDGLDLAGTLAARIERDFPEAVRATVRRGAARLVDYQSQAYAGHYLDRLEAIVALDGALGGAERDHDVLVETARHLALWMSFEDLIRVADLKTRAERLDRVRREVQAEPDQPMTITEFLKPGVEEWCSILPGGLARLVLRLAARYGLTDRLNVGLHVKTTAISGFLLMFGLAKLRPWRPFTHRFGQEQDRIDAWLGMINRHGAGNGDLAVAIADCAELVRGYGDTHRRGSANFDRVTGVLGRIQARPDAAVVLNTLKQAASADPEGDKLTEALGQLDADPAVELAAE